MSFGPREILGISGGGLNESICLGSWNKVVRIVIMNMIIGWRFNFDSFIFVIIFTF